MKKKISPNQKMLFWWGWILIVWSIYRSLFKTSLPIWFDEFIAKPMVFILPVWFYIRRVEKKDFLSRIDFYLKNISTDIMIGLGFGVLMFIIAAFTTHINFSPALIFVLFTALATAVSEEILSRGFLLKRLNESWNNILMSSFFGSILYFFLRVPILFTNERIMGTQLLVIMTVDIIFSFFVSLIFLTRKNLTAPILIHAFYSLYIYLALS